MMTFRVMHKPSNNHVRCPYRVVEQPTGREIDWINQYLDYETLRRLANATLRTYADALLHFLRWWDSVHHTHEVTKDALTESPRSRCPYDSGLGPKIHRLLAGATAWPLASMDADIAELAVAGRVIP